MTFLRVLVEGESDVRIVREVLARRFKLREGEHFVVHPHQGKGKRPSNPRSRPDPKRRGLLDQLPAKLRAFAQEAKSYDLGVIVLLDADNEDCRELKKYLLSLRPSPPKTLYRIAVEELESWFLVDEDAISAAFPKAKLSRLPGGRPDRVIGAWESLARTLGRDPLTVTGKEKAGWANAIAPHLDLDAPSSPSFRVFLAGIETLIGQEEE